MKKSKIVISIILTIAIMISYMPISLATVTDADNGKMKYYLNNLGFVDIQGYVNGTLQSTTYNDGGYKSKLKVDDEEGTLYLNDYTKKEVNGVEWDIDCSFINNGRYVKLLYTLTNKDAVRKTISLGTIVDVQIAENDYATIERFENSKGLKLYNEEKNIQFSFYGKSVAGTTDIDSLWIGTYYEMRDKHFTNNDVNKLEKKDSAFAYSWKNRTIESGDTQRYSVIIGIGEVSNAPKVELDQSQGRCFSQDNVTIKGSISDLDKNSKATLYYTVDNGTENNLPEVTLVNNKANFEINLTSQNLSLGEHNIKLWAIDESGNPSEILQKKILITNLKAPVLNLNEEWSKETVKFTITDTINNQEEVSRYQYKIDDGEWRDIELNAETVALDRTGTAVVSARVVGKQTDEYSSMVSKTAKVDKTKPTIEVTEQNGKVIINVRDEHSGVDNTKYVFSNLEQLDEAIEFLEYEQQITYTSNEEEDIFLHVISTDKLGNESRYIKEYKYPIAGQIETKSEFIVKKPIYKLKDKMNQWEYNYTYQIKINDEEWKNINLDTEYEIENPNEGKNTIKTRTVDTLGRISTEEEATINYIAKDETESPKELPKTGKTFTIAIIMIGLIIYAVTALNKYNKLKGIK